MAAAVEPIGSVGDPTAAEGPIADYAGAHSRHIGAVGPIEAVRRTAGDTVRLRVVAGQGNPGLGEMSWCCRNTP